MGRKRHAVGTAGEEDVEYCAEGNQLLLALFQGDLEAAARLLEAPTCDIEAYDQMGWRPLHRAAFGGHTDILTALLTKRADANVCDLDGLQPLHIAASSCHAEACRLLLDARARPDVPDVNGLRACDYALAHVGDAAAALATLFGDCSSEQHLVAEGCAEEEKCSILAAEDSKMGNIVMGLRGPPDPLCFMRTPSVAKKEVAIALDGEKKHQDIDASKQPPVAGEASPSDVASA